MKTILTTLAFALACSFFSTQVKADEQERVVDSFSEISLRIPGKLHLQQGDKQHIEIVAKASTLDEIVTEVKDRKLILRFPSKNYLWKSFDPGSIIIYVTVPEINALSVSGSGDIIAEDPINSRILDLNISGSGDIQLDELKTDRVTITISGSGDAILKGKETATDLSATVSGSGSVKAANLPVRDVMVKVSGSGDCAVNAENKLTVKIAGSGTVSYRGRPQIEKTVVGSGSIKNID